MRTLFDHKLNGLNDNLAVYAADEPSNGGASHAYAISWGDPTDSTGHSQQTLPITFQKGALSETGPNGISQEVLLAILIDRLRGFQSGPFSCRENAVALTKLEEALMWLQKRTRDRMVRGVEGTMQK